MDSLVRTFMRGNLFRFPKKYTINEILPLVEFKSDDIKYLTSISDRTFRKHDSRKPRKMFDGHLVRLTSSRLRLFALKGITCVSCGITGSFFVKERKGDEKYYHINLYATKEDGQEVLMTKDHIRPKSCGGRNHIDNYQTMCTICNNKKGNDIHWNDAFQELTANG